MEVAKIDRQHQALRMLNELEVGFHGRFLALDQDNVSFADGLHVWAKGMMKIAAASKESIVHST